MGVCLKQVSLSLIFLISFFGCTEKKLKSKRSHIGDLQGRVDALKDTNSGDTISGLEQCPNVKQVYDSFLTPVVSRYCISWHVKDGQAGFSRLILTPLHSGGDVAAALVMLRQMGANKDEHGESILLAKPTLRVPHGGGQLFSADSSQASAIGAFLDANITEEDLACARNVSAAAVRDPILDDHDMAPTRYLRRASLALRGRLPSPAEYAQIQKSPDSFSSMVDNFIDDGNRSGVLHDRVHTHVLKKLLPGLVSDPVTLGSNMLGLGVEVRNKIRDDVPDGLAVDPTVSRIWTVPDGNHNKDLEVSAGCRIQTNENLANWKNEYWNNKNGPLAPNYADCVFEAPLKTALVNWRRYFNPGFSDSFGPSHPLWSERRKLAQLMTPYIGIIQSNTNPSQQEVFGLGSYVLSSGAPDSIPSHLPALSTERVRLLASREDLPWDSLGLLQDATGWQSDTVPGSFKGAFPKKVLTYLDGSKAIASRFDFRLTPVYMQLLNYTNSTSNSCGTISDGARCGFVDRDGPFMEMTKWLPTVDEYPDIYKPGYFSGCLAPGEREKLLRKPRQNDTRTFWDFIAEGQARPAFDSASMVITADALSAVPVNPWWNPDETIYVCPGLAVDTAVNLGIIKQPPFFMAQGADRASYYKIKRKVAPDLTNYLQRDENNPAQDRVASLTYAEYVLSVLHGINKVNVGLGSLYREADRIVASCKIHTFRSQAWQACVRATLHPDWSGYFWEQQIPTMGILQDVTNPNRIYRASVYALDTIYNPLADCGPNLRLCNPSRNALAILSSLEGHALFYKIMRDKLPWKTIINANYRMSNRFLEWARYYTEVEPAAIIAAANAGTVKTKAFIGNGLDFPHRIIAGTWNPPDIMPYLRGVATTPQLEWFRFETSPEKLQMGQTNAKKFPNPDVDGVANRYTTADEGYQFKREWLNYFSPITPAQDSAPAVGILSTSTFLNTVPRDRSRANRALQFATCEGFPPAVGTFSAVESESRLPPRQRVKSGCASCHNQGGVDPMARFFMGYANSRVEETDGNINFIGDPLNFWGFPGYDDRVSPGWLAGKSMGLAGFGYVRENAIMALNSNGYYGRNEQGVSVDSWKGIPVNSGLAGLSRVLLEEPKFTLCTVKNAWKLAMGRDPTSRESIQVNKVVNALRQKSDYSFQDALREVINAPAFKKER